MTTNRTVEDRHPIGARALWHVAPGRSEVRQEILLPPGRGEVLVRARYSAVSRGTERLVREGRVPASEARTMRAPCQAGEFPFPVKYGYCAVGEVVDGEPAWVGRRVFALHPHQDLFVLPATAVTEIPAGVPMLRAVLAANVETSLNALWDAAAAPGMRIAVVGAGTVGSLVAWLAGRLPGAEVTLVDPLPAREATAAALGVAWARPEAAPVDCDLVFHASASAAGLDTALRCAGDEAKVVELSWYGDRPVEASLGAAFHARRLSLVGSQVGRVAPVMRPRWTTARRLAKALSLLSDPAPDVLLAGPLSFVMLPARVDELFDPAADAPCPVIAYPIAPGDGPRADSSVP